MKIPAGARNGLKVRVADAVPTSTGQKQDLYLVMQVDPDPSFERKGDDLHSSVQTDLYTAVLGGEVTVPTLSGNVVLTIPPGAQFSLTYTLSNYLTGSADTFVEKCGGVIFTFHYRRAGVSKAVIWYLSPSRLRTELRKAGPLASLD